jgi:hypothetical protein
MKTVLLLSLFLVFLQGCLPEDPYLTDEEMAKIHDSSKFMLATIMNHDLFLISGKGYYYSTKRITFDSLPKRDVKINWSSDKIAFINHQDKVVIVEVSSGNTQEINTQSSIKQIDWLDDSTLYMFDGVSISFYGNTYEVPPLAVPGSISPNLYTDYSIITACVNTKAELIYVMKFRNSHTWQEFYRVICRNKTTVKTFELDHWTFCFKVYYDGLGRINLLASGSDSEDYLFSKMGIYKNFNILLNTNTLSFDNRVAVGYYDSEGYYDPENPDFTVFGTPTPLYPDCYDLHIWEDPDGNYTMEKASKGSRLYFDFK